MAKLKTNDLKKLKFISVADMYKNMDKYDSLDDKLAYLTRYVLSYEGAKDNREFSFAGVIEAARTKIVEESAKQKDSKKNLKAQLFITNPEEYLKGETQKLMDEIDNKDVVVGWESDLREDLNKVNLKLNDNLTKKVDDVHKLSAFFGVKSKMEYAVGGKEALEELYKGTQPRNFFQRMFSSSSDEWNQLEESWDAFTSPVKQGCGKMDHLNEAATNYLKHKFPSWKPGEEIPAEAYTKLNARDMSKVNFSLNILNAIKEQQETEKIYDTAIEDARKMHIKYSDIPQEEKSKVIDLDEVEFQNEVKNDIAESDHDIDVNEKLDNEELEVENEEEVEKDDEPLSIN